jgi:hypothetical protein
MHCVARGHTASAPLLKIVSPKTVLVPDGLIGDIRESPCRLRKIIGLFGTYFDVKFCIFEISLLFL